MKVEFYTAETVAKLEAAISAERFERYVELAGGDRIEGIHLYERNTALSEALFGVIQGLEVALRNALSRVLVPAWGAEWYEGIPWKQPERDAIAKAKAKISFQRKEVTPGRLVAELSFGFWVALVQKSYAKLLWDAHLHKAFPSNPMDHRIAHLRLEEIRRLRNLIAHHNRIMERDLAADYNMLIDTIAWICPATADWVRGTNCFEERFKGPHRSQDFGAPLAGEGDAR